MLRNPLTQITGEAGIQSTIFLALKYVHVIHTHSIPHKQKLGGVAFDLHALSTPPAFILSQDQTLNKRKFSQIESVAEASDDQDPTQRVVSLWLKTLNRWKCPKALPRSPVRRQAESFLIPLKRKIARLNRYAKHSGLGPTAKNCDYLVIDCDIQLSRFCRNKKRIVNPFSRLPKQYRDRI
jgi:hypothetical protein